MPVPTPVTVAREMESAELPGLEPGVELGWVSSLETTPNKIHTWITKQKWPVGRRKGVTDVRRLLKSLLQMKRILDYKPGSSDFQIIFCFTGPNIDDKIGLL